MPIIMMVGLGAAVVVFFVIGISLVFKSQNELIDQEVLPVQQKYEEVTRTLDAAKTQEQDLKQQLDKLAVELQETQGQLVQTQDIEKELSQVKALKQADQEKMQGLSEQLAQLKQKTDIQDQGAREMEGQNKILKEQLTALRNKADELAKGSLSAIEQMSQQTKGLQEQVLHLSKRPDTDEYGSLKMKNEALQADLEKLLTQVHDFEKQLKTEKETTGRDLAAAKDTIAQLSGEGEKLKEALRQITAKIDETNTEFLSVKESYEKQLAESQLQLERAREEKILLERQSVSADQFNDLAAELYKVREEKAELAASVGIQGSQFVGEREALSREIAANRAKIAELESKLSACQSELSKRMRQPSSDAGVQQEGESRDPLHVAALLHDKRILEQSLADLERTNQALSEREKMLFSELLKLKVKSLGLEKICAGMKEKIDQT